MLISLPKLVINFVIMEAAFLGFTTQDAMAHAGAAGAIMLAFLLRIAVEWGKDKLTLKSVVIQAISTAALCFLAIYVWHDYLDYKKGFEIYVFFASLFSVFIVNEIDVLFQMGFRKWAKTVVVKILATDNTEGIK